MKREVVSGKTDVILTEALILKFLKCWRLSHDSCRPLNILYISNQTMVVNPAKLQMPILIHESLRNWNKSRKNGMFKIIAKTKIAPPATQNKALLGVAIILNILSVHDRFVKIIAIFEIIRVVKVIALTSLASYPICRLTK